MKQSKIFKATCVASAFFMAVVSCKKEPGKDGPDDPVKPDVPEKQEVNLTAAPDGQDDLMYGLVAEGDWYVEADDYYAWISVSPEEGKGDTEIVFSVKANETGRDRAATYLVYDEGNNLIYEIFITQSKQDLPILDGDREFLEAIIAGKMLGELTPGEITDWYSFTGGEFGGTGINIGTASNGKYCVEAIDGAPLVNFPRKLDLAGLQFIKIRGQYLAGIEMPEEWNTPKLYHVNMSNTGMTGVIPDGFAASPELVEIYLDGCDFYGALPHEWASRKLEVVLLANANNHALPEEGEEVSHRDHTGNSPGLGYMVPASLDVIMNEDRSGMQNDKTQMKLGGTCNGNYIGFEKGWGQARYEKYDKDAVKGDTSVWSDMRLLVGDGSDDNNSWAWYFSNMGYPGFYMDIPNEMLEWNQADADAYTARCRAARGK